MSTGFDLERLQRIQAWQRKLVDAGALPCAVTLVNQGGSDVYLHAEGWADVAARRPVAADSIFRFYSMTKPIVSIGLMLLYEEGRFQLTDPVHAYLGPAWHPREMHVFDRWRGVEGRKSADYESSPCDSPITIANLLTHTAGLSYGFDPSGRGIAVDRVYAKKMQRPTADEVGADDPSMLAGFCEALAAMPLWYQPGTCWNYSFATDVCGRLIEVIAGQPLDVFLEERLFKPLGMVDSGFDVAHDAADRLVHNHQYAAPTPGETRDLDPLLAPHIGTFRDIDEASRSSYLNASRPKMLSGGGGLAGTIGDYSAFCRLLLAGGVTPSGDRLIGRKTIEFVTSNHLPGGQGLMDLVPNPDVQYSETAKNGGAFGLGFAIQQSPAAAGSIGSVGSFAWGGAAATLFWCDPVEDLHVVFCTQVMGMQPPNALRAKLASMVYGALV